MVSNPNPSEFITFFTISLHPRILKFQMAGGSVVPYPLVIAVSINPGVKLVTRRLECSLACIRVRQFKAAFERP